MPLGVRLSRCHAVRVCVCLSAEPRLHAALVLAAKVMRCIQCCLASSVDVRQLKAELRQTKCRLEESERLRQLVDEQAEKSRVSYESEISWLKMQLSTFEEDFKSERRAREATATTLEQVRCELAAAQSQVGR